MTTTTTTTAALLAEARRYAALPYDAAPLVAQLADALEAQKAISVALMRSENELQARLAKVLKLLGEARPHIGDEYSRSWPDDPEFDTMLARIDGELAYSDGPARPMEPGT